MTSNTSELSAGDPKLLRYVMGFMGLNLGQVSCLLTIIKRYLDKEVSAEELDTFSVKEQV